MVFYFWCFQAWTYPIIIVFSRSVSKGFIHLTPKLPLIDLFKKTKPFLKAKYSRFSLRNWSLFKFLINHRLEKMNLTKGSRDSLEFQSRIRKNNFHSKLRILDYYITGSSNHSSSWTWFAAAGRRLYNITYIEQLAYQGPSDTWLRVSSSIL